MQEVTVAAFMPQPGAQRPTHDKQQQQTSNESDQDEPAGEINLECEYHDGHRAENRGGSCDDAFEFFGTDT